MNFFNFFFFLYLYKVHPASAIVSTSVYDNEYYSIRQVVESAEDGTGIITIQPKKECASPITIAFEAINPKDNNRLIGNVQVSGYIQYKDITPKINIIEKDGRFSSYDEDTNILTIGDGETLDILVSAKEENANYQITSVEFVENAGKNKDEKTGKQYISNAEKKVDESTPTQAVYTINGGEDKIEYLYEIVEAYVPTYQGEKVLNWETDFVWWQDSDLGEGWNFGNKYACYYCLGLGHKTYSNRDVNTATYSTNRASIFEQNWLNLRTTSSKYSNNQWYDSFTYKTSSTVYDFKYANVDFVNDEYIYTSLWGKQLDPSLKGKVYSEYDFKNIAWFYCPGTTNTGDGIAKWEKGRVNSSYGENNKGKYDSNYPVYVEQGILTNHVQAISYPTNDTKVTVRQKAGELKITILHNGKTVVKTVPVYYNERNCDK